MSEMMPRCDEMKCKCAWGHCDERSPTYFGKPTATPHTCKGVTGHSYPLHVCEKCGCVGAIHQPLAFTKAGRTLRRLVLAEASRHAMENLRIHLERQVKLAEIRQPSQEITTEG